jgi:hypothetical protein
MIKDMKVDPKFTKLIQDWLNKEPKEPADALGGAQLLYRINPRNVMYRRFIQLAVSRPERIMPKIEYELKNHLKYRLDGLTLEEVNRLDREVIPEASKIIENGQPDVTPSDTSETPENTDTPDTPETPDSPKTEPSENLPRLGRRADHEQLPEEIKKLWEDNGRLYKDIKAVFEELKSMEDLPSCQRYDKLQLLASMDKRYLKQMQQYDEYDASKGNEQAAAEKEQKPADPVKSARSYISKNTAKLAALYGKAHQDGASVEDWNAYQEFLWLMQARVNTLIAADVVTDKMRDSLIGIGIVFETPVPLEDKADEQADTAAEAAG